MRRILLISAVLTAYSTFPIYYILIEKGLDPSIVIAYILMKFYPLFISLDTSIKVNLSVKKSLIFINIFFWILLIASQYSQAYSIIEFSISVIYFLAGEIAFSTVLKFYNFEYYSSTSLPYKPHYSVKNDNSAKFKDGFIIFQHPNKMTVGSKRRFEANVFTDKILANNINNNIINIELTNTMKVKLNCLSEFEIKSLSSEIQVLQTNTVTRWLWDVKALKSGSQKVQFHVSILVPVGNSQEYTDLTPTIRTIKVTKDYKYILKEHFRDNWKYWLTLFGSGLVLAVLKKYNVV